MLARTTTSTLSRCVASSRRALVAKAAGVQHHRQMSSDTQSPSSFSAEKMDTDKRYQKTSEIPESLLSTSEDSGYSIRGQFRDGRAAYLDMSATTPLDPRVLDAMAPFMVRPPET